MENDIIVDQILGSLKNKSKEDPMANFAIDAKRAAIRKLKDAIKSDDDDSMMIALDELKELDRD
jgi:hypothetical protein